MSINDIPPEIDELILSYLPRNELSATSKVCKYYREVAEPLLYRNIRLLEEDSINVRPLLLTLLSRSDLAARIRKLEVKPGTRLSRSLEQSSNIHTRLEQAQPAIQDSVRKILGPSWDAAGPRTAWFGSILSEDFVEGTTALIVCLATNVKLVHMRFDPDTVAKDSNCGCFFSKMLFEAASKRSSHSMTLSCLVTLIVQGGGTIYMPNLPRLAFIRVLDCDNIVFPLDQDTVHKSQPPLGRILKLEPKNTQTIELFHTSTLPSLAKFLNQKGAPQLQNLVVHSRRATSTDGFQATIDALSARCDQLTTLTLTVDQHVPQNGWPLSNLPRLRHLRGLRVDLRFLLLRENQNQLLNSSGILPPKLTKLEIRDVAYRDVGDIMSVNNAEDPLMLRSFFPDGPPIKKFFFNIGQSYVPKEGYDTLLATIARTLRAQGVEFQVYRAPTASNERGLQPLIQHDHTIAQ